LRLDDSELSVIVIAIVVLGSTLVAALYWSRADLDRATRSGISRLSGAPLNLRGTAIARNALLALGAVLAAAVLFHWFFRYQYVEAGTRVMRIDRLTGASCLMPCHRLITALTTPSPGSEVETDAQLVDYMRTTYGLSHQEDEGEEWRVIGHFDNDGNPEPGFTAKQLDEMQKGLLTPPPQTTYSVRVVCFCDGQNVGDYYEVRPTEYGSFSAMEISGNSVLEQKYEISTASSPPRPPGSTLPKGLTPIGSGAARPTFDPSTAGVPPSGFAPDASRSARPR
jgi:hypothetical protein